MAQFPLDSREVRTMLSPFFLSISMMSVSYIGFLFRNFQRKERLVGSTTLHKNKIYKISLYSKRIESILKILNAKNSN